MNGNYVTWDVHETNDNSVTPKVNVSFERIGPRYRCVVSVYGGNGTLSAFPSFWSSILAQNGDLREKCLCYELEHVNNPLNARVGGLIFVIRLFSYNCLLPETWAWTSNIEILERFQSKVLRIITDAPWHVPTAVIIQVLSVRHEVRNYSVTYRQRLNNDPNSLAKSLFQRPNYNRRLKWYYPADLANRFNWYSATPPETIPIICD